MAGGQRRSGLRAILRWLLRVVPLICGIGSALLVEPPGAFHDLVAGETARSSDLLWAKAMVGLVAFVSGLVIVSLLSRGLPEEVQVGFFRFKRPPDPATTALVEQVFQLLRDQQASREQLQKAMALQEDVVGKLNELDQRLAAAEQVAGSQKDIADGR